MNESLEHDPHFHEARAMAKAQRVSLFVNASERKAGRAYIQLKKGDLVLAEFYDSEDVLAWLKGVKQ